MGNDELADAEVKAELDAMQTINGALALLPSAARARVLQWAAARFDVGGSR